MTDRMLGACSRLMPAVVVFLLAACGSSSPVGNAVSGAVPDPQPSIDSEVGLLLDARRCDPLDPHHCMFPWPNDFFTVEDEATDTGRRVAISALAMPRNVLGKPIDPREWNRNDGFSQASLRGYLRVPGITRAMLANADLLCAQTRVDAQRLRNLGAPAHLIHVTGNLKFDVELPEKLLDDARTLRAHWGRDRPVWIAASTHAGEERKVLDAYARLKLRWPALLLVLVPRHPERFQGVTRLCRQRGFAVALRSRTPGELPAGTEILVGDTMGELQRLYAAADLAFIGGSLVPHGGQNLLEACAVRVPVVFGPHMFHFEEISAMALERGAARQILDVAGLVDAVALYFEQPDLRRAAGAAAHTLVTDNRGALGRTLVLIVAALRLAGWTAAESARDPHARPPAAIARAQRD